MKSDPLHQNSSYDPRLKSMIQPGPDFFQNLNLLWLKYMRAITQGSSRHGPSQGRELQSSW